MSQNNGHDGPAVVGPGDTHTATGSDDPKPPIVEPKESTPTKQTVGTHKEAKQTKRKRTRSKPHPSPQTAKLIRNLEGLHGEAQKHADKIGSAIKELKKGAK